MSIEQGKSAQATGTFRHKHALSNKFAVRARYLTISLAIISLGLLLRLAPIGLPYALTKYGGSALWGAMVYTLVRTCLPSSSMVKAIGGPLSLQF
jgi:hypothetical protein